MNCKLNPNKLNTNLDPLLDFHYLKLQPMENLEHQHYIAKNLHMCLINFPPYEFELVNRWRNTIYHKCLILHLQIFHLCLLQV
jgi:hypothetical protein